MPIIDGANSDDGTSFSPLRVNTSPDFASDVTEVGAISREAPDHAGASSSLAEPFLSDLLAA